MKNEKLKEYLMAQGVEYLADKIISISTYDRLLSKELEFIILKSDPKKLAKKLNQQINGIAKHKTFVTWDKELEFIQELEQIIEIIEKDLMPNDLTLAIELIEKLFAIDQTITEIVDGSNGCVGMFYQDLAELWGKACMLIDKTNLSLLPKKIYDLLINNHYGTRDKIIENSAKALGKEGLRALEQIIKDNESQFFKYSLYSIYTDIADGLDDVDKYIAIIKQYGSLNESTVCSVAKRLITKWRGEEAIDWLMHQPEDIGLDLSLPKPECKIMLSKRYDLLLEAFELESMVKEAEKLRWALFEKTLSKTYYDSLLKHQPSEIAEKIKARAFNFAKNYGGSINTILQFLNEIQEYSEIEEIILEKYQELNGENYSFYRPLSKTLATAGHPLAACLLRRKLIDNILARALAKYYKYAISDLKLAGDFSNNVKNWFEHLTHTQYLEKLKKDHPRKQAFWSNLN